MTYAHFQQLFYCAAQDISECDIYDMVLNELTRIYRHNCAILAKIKSQLLIVYFIFMPTTCLITINRAAANCKGWSIYSYNIVRKSVDNKVSLYLLLTWSVHFSFWYYSIILHINHHIDQDEDSYSSKSLICLEDFALDNGKKSKMLPWCYNIVKYRVNKNVWRERDFTILNTNAHNLYNKNFYTS